MKDNCETFLFCSRYHRTNSDVNQDVLCETYILLSSIAINYLYSVHTISQLKMSLYLFYESSQFTDIGQIEEAKFSSLIQAFVRLSNAYKTLLLVTIQTLKFESFFITMLQLEHLSNEVILCIWDQLSSADVIYRFLRS